MTLQNKLRALGEGLAGISSRFHHYRRVEKAGPFGVWAEQFEENSFHADNGKQRQGIHCAVNYFTPAEFDPILDDIQTFLESTGCDWALDNVEYEDETKLIHYSWSVTVYGEIND